MLDEHHDGGLRALISGDVQDATALTGLPGQPGQQDQDLRFVRATLAFGRRSLGLAAPNPSVGALVVKDGVVIGRGVTAPGGRPHAEPTALRQAGAAARGATLYVSLEPCSHFGRSPPCADAIIASGVTRVVSALRDPDPRVAGRGVDRLRTAGIEVVEGLGEREARRDHLGHIRRVTLGRPTITVKMAETSDGLAGALPGEPRLMITGAEANAYVHMLRASHDAVMVGRATAEEDDPLLTVRLPGMDARRPTRVVLDPRLQLRSDSRLVQTAMQSPLLLLADPEASPAREQLLADLGAVVSRVAATDTGLVLSNVLTELEAWGVTRVLCEGGPTLASAMIVAGLADRVVLLTGSRSSSGRGRRVLTRAALERIEDRGSYRLCEEGAVGTDRLRVFESTDI